MDNTQSTHAHGMPESVGPLAKEKMLVERRLAEINRLLRRRAPHAAREKQPNSTTREITGEETGG